MIDDPCVDGILPRSYRGQIPPRRRCVFTSPTSIGQDSSRSTSYKWSFLLLTCGQFPNADKDRRPSLKSRASDWLVDCRETRQRCDWVTVKRRARMDLGGV
jgi:hypothetical protein